MKSFRLFLREIPHADTTIRFNCEADDIKHAIEQAENAYPQCEVTSVFNTDVDPTIAGAIVRSSDVGEYEVHQSFERCSLWLTVANASLWIQMLDGSLRVSAYSLGGEGGNAIAWLDADYEDLRPTEEAISVLDDEQIAVHARFAPSAEDYWQKLRDVPVNERDELEEDVLDFKAGIHRDEVWRWLEAKFPRFSVGARMSRPQGREGALPR